MKTELNRQASASNAGSGEMMKERNYTSSLHSPLLLFCYAYVEWKNALDLSSRKKEKLL